MKTLLNKIFADSGCLTKKELEKYLKGNSTPEEIAEIEKKIQNNPFNSDAIEGFSENVNSIDDLKDIQRKLKAKYKSSFSWSMSLSTLIIALAISVAAYYFLNSYQAKKQEITQVNNPVDSTVNTNIFVNENFYLKPEQTAENPKEKMSVTVKSQETEENQTRTAEQIEKVKSINSLDCLKSESNVEVKMLNRSIVKTIYICDLKVVDYRGLRKKKTGVQSGLPSSFENKSNVENQNEDYIAEQPYINFLSNALKLFNSNDYKAANKEFNVILSYYPDDANAIFYSGLSYFQMADYEKAEKRLTQMLNHTFNTFYDESQWYLSQAFLLSGKKKEAIDLLKTISAEDGFYSQRAKNKLNDN